MQVKEYYLGLALELSNRDQPCVSMHIDNTYTQRAYQPRSLRVSFFGGKSREQNLKIRVKSVQALLLGPLP